MKKLIKHIEIMSIFVMSVYLQSCCYNSPIQEEWHMKRLLANSVVESLSHKESLFLNEEQLIAILGKPDLKVTPIELEQLLVQNDSYRKEIMSELCTQYCRAKQKLDISDCRCLCEDVKWKNFKEFKNCSLLLYDESRHFKQPIDYDCPWCAHAGFKCHFFIIERANVIGSIAIAFWEPLGSAGGMATQ